MFFSKRGAVFAFLPFSALFSGDQPVCIPPLLLPVPAKDALARRQNMLSSLHTGFHSIIFSQILNVRAFYRCGINLKTIQFVCFICFRFVDAV